MTRIKQLRPPVSQATDELSDVASRDRRHLASALQALELFFIDAMPQKSIAKAMRISPASVSRLIAFGRAHGLIRLTLHPPVDLRLTSRLPAHLRRYGIREVYVGGFSAIDVGHIAASLMRSRIKSGDICVVDGGRTVEHCINAISAESLPKTTFIAVCADPPSYAVSAVELVARLSSNSPNVSVKKIPHFTGTPLRRIHEDIRSTAQKADFVLLGVGPWKRRYTALEFVRHLGLEPEELRRSFPQVCGVSAYCPITADGGLVDIEQISSRVPRALSFADLQCVASSKTCTSMLLAHSAKKAEAVLSAIKAGICNTLIIDEKLAEKVFRA